MCKKKRKQSRNKKETGNLWIEVRIQNSADALALHVIYNDVLIQRLEFCYVDKVTKTEILNRRKNKMRSCNEFRKINL